ncbi:retrovirus-related pol polyprotein from transposon TNT 1-94, partial [Tanacetum coccineum]
FCGMKGIKREFSVARTPQQNRVAERKNRTLIEATRTMLADSLLPTTFWAKVVTIACYVHNRVLVTKPHNKTPYELLLGRIPSISFMRPFGCPVTILNTLDPLGKFDEKADEGFFVGYSINSKAFRVFNTRTRKVEENLHINFLENKHNVAGSRPDWLFDIDLLTNSMNYEPSSKDAVVDDANEEPTLKGEGSGQPSEPQLPSSTAPPSQVTTVATQHQKTHKPRRAKRGRDTEIPQSSGPPKKVGDDDVYTGEYDRVVRATTTASSLEAEQESGNIHKT